VADDRVASLPISLCHELDLPPFASTVRHRLTCRKPEQLGYCSSESPLAITLSDLRHPDSSTALRKPCCFSACLAASRSLALPGAQTSTGKLLPRRCSSPARPSALHIGRSSSGSRAAGLPRPSLRTCLQSAAHRRHLFQPTWPSRRSVSIRTSPPPPPTSGRAKRQDRLGRVGRRASSASSASSARSGRETNGGRCVSTLG
jgi:hypothetical protein